MYVNHPSLTQSVHWISFSAVLHRACDWFTGTFSLKLEWHTMLVFVEALTHTHKHTCTHTHMYISLAYMLLHWVSSARGGELVPMLPTKTPLRFPQGRHVQLAVPTSVQNGLKTGMREACLRCLTLARRPRFWGKNDCYSRQTTAWMMHTCGVVHLLKCKCVVRL